MKIGKKKKNQTGDFLAQEAKEEAQQAAEYTLDIPEDEIWTYQIEGLQAPKVGYDYSKERSKKILVVVVLLIAISCSIYLSVRAVHNDEYKYTALDDGTYELVKYSNSNSLTDVTVNYINSDSSMPITVLHEYAFNCDEAVVNIYLSADVSQIDSKAFYSCWSLQNIYVDDNNPYYCDIDGVLYNKDMTEIIHYPENHTGYLREKYGFDYLTESDDDYAITEQYGEAVMEEYNLKVRTYVLPSTVTKIGELAFAYCKLHDLYMPVGVTTIEAMGVFKVNNNYEPFNIYSYTADEVITDTSWEAVNSFSAIYYSLPDGLQYIGSDAFTYDKGLSYMYIPSSVTYIGHHAFWDSVYKDGGELYGVTEMNVGMSEDEFDNIEVKENWLPKYDNGAFKKTISVNYGAERIAVPEE